LQCARAGKDLKWKKRQIARPHLPAGDFARKWSIGLSLASASVCKRGLQSRMGARRRASLLAGERAC
jgi:hypothetical protein